MSLDPSDLDTSKPTSVYTPRGPRPQTLSVALPASLLHNSKRKLDLRTSLAGNISRALAVFSVDEVVIYDDGDGSAEESSPPTSTSSLTAFSHPGHFLRFLLTYQETPPFMRSRLFPVCEDLKSAGLLPSLDIPSHLRATDVCEFREGITTSTTKAGTYVDCGLPAQKVLKGVHIRPKTRVTLRLTVDETSAMNGDRAEEEHANAMAVAPDTPRTEAGYYWGYGVREAQSLSAVFTEAGFDGGYDLSVGTSERGVDVTGVVEELNGSLGQRGKGEGWMHMLIVFGGVKGLEDAAANDDELKKVGVGRGNVGQLFDYWVNLLPGQGSRTVRTEEALWMGLMALRGVVDAR